MGMAIGIEDDLLPGEQFPERPAPLFALASAPKHIPGRLRQILRREVTADLEPRAGILLQHLADEVIDQFHLKLRNPSADGGQEIRMIEPVETDRVYGVFGPVLRLQAAGFGGLEIERVDLRGPVIMLFGGNVGIDEAFPESRFLRGSRTRPRRWAPKRMKDEVLVLLRERDEVIRPQEINPSRSVFVYRRAHLLRAQRL